MEERKGYLRAAKCTAVINDVLRSIMQDYMDKNTPKPTNELYKILLKDDKFVKKLSPEAHSQLQNLVHGFKQLDITLLYKIARYFKSFYDPPTRSWNADPLPTEMEIGDDMQRIRRARNKYAHCVSITEQEMDYFFQVVTEVGLRFDQRLKKTENDSFEYRIKSYAQMEIGKFEKKTFEVEVQPGNTIHVFLTESTLPEIKTDKVHYRMHIYGIGNETEVADKINERKEKINEESKLIKLDRATIGSLIFHLSFHSSLFSDPDLLRRELERIIQLLFTDLKHPVSEEINAVITIEREDDTVDSECSSDEDDDDDRNLVLDITVRPDVFSSTNAMAQHFDSFVKAVSTNMNGQKINWESNVKAVLETGKEVNRCHNSELEKQLVIPIKENKDTALYDKVFPATKEYDTLRRCHGTGEGY